jgi:rieske iron-sulfur protein
MAQASRRVIVGGMLLAAASRAGASRADDEPDPVRDATPQPGDFLVLADADHASTAIRPEDVKMGDDPALAWALDPRARVPRDGSRLNQVLLMRFDPSALGDEERQRAVDGVVAYSAICTHQGCTITDWIKAKQVLQCPCHQSQYDPKHEAKVVAGPAPRALPALPLKLSGNLLVVAARFTDRVGGEKTTG